MRFILKNKIFSNFVKIILFGSISFLLGLVRFDIPGIEGAVSDLREVPLLISVFYFTNPLYLIGVSLITALGTPPEGSIFSTFIMHAGALIIFWYINKLFKFISKSSILGLLWFLCVLFYYLIILILMVLTNYLVGLNQNINLINFYFDLISQVYFEAIVTALITSIYLVQLKVREKLVEHQANLERIVNERTKSLLDTVEELKTTQLQLVQSEKMASLGILASGLAHEINNPLNFIQGGIMGLEEYFNDKFKENIPEVLPLLNGMQEGVFRAAEIVTSLNHYSQKDSLQKTECNIHHIINDCLVMIQNLTRNRIGIVKNFGTTQHLVIGNESQLSQVILNILTNAAHAIENNGIIKISTSIRNAEIVIQVADNGIGIKPENLKKIFDPFFTTKEPGKGTGLGLSIAYNIILDHKGKIEIKSESGIGTEVIIKLPLMKI